MQYRYEIEHAPANLARRREGLYSLIRHAQKQYRYEIEHAPANLAPTKGWTVTIEEIRSNA